MAHKYTIDQINEMRPKPSLLTAIYYLPFEKGKNTKVYCTCECGGEISATLTPFIKGETHSCGCRTRWGNKFPVFINKKESPLYKKYHGMMDRCYNANVRSYKFYGAKGVTVCDEWRHNFQAFAEWAVNSGFSIGLNLDKDIKAKEGVNKIYSPSTCSWVTPQMNCRARTTEYLVNGKMLTISEIASIYGFHRDKVKSYIQKRKHTVEEFLLHYNLI